MLSTDWFGIIKCKFWFGVYAILSVWTALQLLGSATRSSAHPAYWASRVLALHIPWETSESEMLTRISIATEPQPTAPCHQNEAPAITDPAPHFFKIFKFPKSPRLSFRPEIKTLLHHLTLVLQVHCLYEATTYYWPFLRDSAWFHAALTRLHRRVMPLHIW
jgi:hypothetical protein